MERCRSEDSLKLGLVEERAAASALYDANCAELDLLIRQAVDRRVVDDVTELRRLREDLTVEDFLPPGIGDVEMELEALVADGIAEELSALEGVLQEERTAHLTQKLRREARKHTRRKRYSAAARVKLQLRADAVQATLVRTKRDSVLPGPGY